MSTVPIAMPWLLWAGSAVLLFLFAKGVHLRSAMRRWPRTAGVIRAHEIRSHSGHHGAGHHRLIVIVEYAVAGRRRRIRCDSPTRAGWSHEEQALSDTDQFPIGARVSLYVDPNNARRAFLYLPEQSTLVVLFLAACFLLIVGIGMH